VNPAPLLAVIATAAVFVAATILIGMARARERNA